MLYVVVSFFSLFFPFKFPWHTICYLSVVKKYDRCLPFFKTHQKNMTEIRKGKGRRGDVTG